MNSLRLLAVAAIASISAIPASAQHYHGHDRHGHDRHGHWNDNHRMLEVLDAHARHRPRFYIDNGRYYFTSRTASLGVAPRPEVMSFGGFSHVDDLAVELEELSNQLCIDLYYNYSHNPGFRETYTEAYQIYEVAKYIHDAEHNYDRAEIRRRLGGLDSLFHHVEDDVRSWTRIHHRQVGHLGIIAKMEAMEEALHHLMNDVGVQLSPAITEAPVPGSLGAPLPPSSIAP